MVCLPSFQRGLMFFGSSVFLSSLLFSTMWSSLTLFLDVEKHSSFSLPPVRSYHRWIKTWEQRFSRVHLHSCLMLIEDFMDETVLPKKIFQIMCCRSPALQTLSSVRICDKTKARDERERDEKKIAYF